MATALTQSIKAVALNNATLEGSELISTPIGDIELVHDFFDDDSSSRLFDEMDLSEPLNVACGAMRS